MKPKSWCKSNAGSVSMQMPLCTTNEMYVSQHITECKLLKPVHATLEGGLPGDVTDMDLALRLHL